MNEWCSPLIHNMEGILSMWQKGKKENKKENKKEKKSIVEFEWSAQGFWWPIRNCHLHLCFIPDTPNALREVSPTNYSTQKTITYLNLDTNTSKPTFYLF